MAYTLGIPCFSTDESSAFMYFLFCLAAIFLLSHFIRLTWLWAFAIAGLVVLENFTLNHAMELTPYEGRFAASAALPVVMLLLIS